jgi:hypothetical protein
MEEWATAGHGPWWRGDRRERYWVVVEYRFDEDVIGDPVATKRGDSAGNTPWHHRLVTAARVVRREASPRRGGARKVGVEIADLRHSAARPTRQPRGLPRSGW